MSEHQSLRELGFVASSHSPLVDYRLIATSRGPVEAPDTFLGCEGPSAAFIHPVNYVAAHGRYEPRHNLPVIHLTHALSIGSVP